MIRIGKEPFLECSTKGDKRFSAFYARIKSRGNLSIEEIYQAAKIFEGGVRNLNWKDAKGKKAVNQEEVALLYSKLWREYFSENPELINVITQYKGFSDIFGQMNHCCQAMEIYEIYKLNKDIVPVVKTQRINRMLEEGISDDNFFSRFRNTK